MFTQVSPFNTIKDANAFLRGATVKNNRQEKGKNQVKKEKHIIY